MGPQNSPDSGGECNIGARPPQTKEAPMRSLAALVFAAVLAACASSGGDPAPALAIRPQSAWIVNNAGERIGQAVFNEAPGGVLIRLEFSAGALPPGWRDLHLHGAGDCSDPADGFQRARAHVGHDPRREHGLLNPAGAEQGDLPNLFAAPSGPFGAELFTGAVTLSNVSQSGRMPLLDLDGAALVVHANPDDHMTQPIGGAGVRIACAALTRLP